MHDGEAQLLLLFHLPESNSTQGQDLLQKETCLRYRSDTTTKGRGLKACCQKLPTVRQCPQIRAWLYITDELY